MTDLTHNEEELNLLRQENQALRVQVDLLDETISLQREQIDLKEQLIAGLQRETTLLTQQVQKIQDYLKRDSYGTQTPLSSVRFSRPIKSLRKKSHQKHI
jgi:CHASE3 domain sensor protein